jgi:class 3 adenylate cyclase
LGELHAGGKAEFGVDAVQLLGIEVRAGLHTGECEVRGDDIGGIGVHIGARVTALAGPNDVLVSSTLRDLVIGSGLGSRSAVLTRSRACPANGASSPSPFPNGRFRRNSIRPP